MKRIAYVFLSGVVLAGMLVTVSAAQDAPLGDYARSVRKDEKPASAKKYDNDNLPTSDNISVVGNSTDSAGPEDANPAPEANAAKPEDGAAASLRSRRKLARRMKPPTRKKPTTNGRRRSPISRTRLTCCRANWM